MNEIQITYQFDRGQQLPDQTYPVRCAFQLVGALASSEVVFILSQGQAEAMLADLRRVTSPLVIAHEGTGDIQDAVATATTVVADATTGGK